MRSIVGEIVLKGAPISRGIAVGKGYFYAPQEDSVPEFAIPNDGIEQEIARYRQALQRSNDELLLLQRQLQDERVVEGVAILEAYLQMNKDPLFTDHIESRIRLAHKNAEFVLQKTVEEYQHRFGKIEDPFFRERSKDVQDVSRRLLRCLKDSVRVTLAQAPANSIVFAYDLTASDVAEANNTSICAFVTTSGGTTSHAAIVAKAKGIPFVTHVPLEGLNLLHEVSVIVDGRSGEVILNPGQETFERYAIIIDAIANQQERIGDSSGGSSETYDGYAIRLSANIEDVAEVGLIHQYGGHGVGLYRSEYEFFAQESFPTEDEQFQAYRKAVEMMRGLPIVMRTFDIGGDKQMFCYPLKLESNPIMGRRAIRLLLQEKEIFKGQLRAMLRASIYGDISILFPMVSALSELIEAKKLLREVQEEMMLGGVAFAQNIRVGCMIEVPSAAIIADLLAEECDFLSIGTNDLVQYSLAVDRGNHSVSNLYTPAHPSIIRLIRLVVHEANQAGIPVAVCGEIAADPRFTPLLLGLGVHELSVAPRHIPVIKSAIRSASIIEATVLAERVMTLSSASEIQSLLDQEYERLAPNDCFYVSS